MKILLEPFARSCIEGSFGEDLPAGGQAAIRHYVRRLRSRRQPAALPPFQRGPVAGADCTELELAVPGELESALNEEARRQDVSLDRIFAHAVFVYFADLDASAAEAAKEEAVAPRSRFHANPAAPTAPARRGPRSRDRGCLGARAGGERGPGAG